MSLFSYILVQKDEIYDIRNLYILKRVCSRAVLTVVNLFFPPFMLSRDTDLSGFRKLPHSVARGGTIVLLMTTLLTERYSYLTTNINLI